MTVNDRQEPVEAALDRVRQVLEGEAIHDALYDAAYDRRALGGFDGLRPGLVVIDLERAVEDVRSAILARSGLTRPKSAR